MNIVHFEEWLWCFGAVVLAVMWCGAVLWYCATVVWCCAVVLWCGVVL